MSPSITRVTIFWITLLYPPGFAVGDGVSKNPAVFVSARRVQHLNAIGNLLLAGHPAENIELPARRQHAAMIHAGQFLVRELDPLARGDVISEQADGGFAGRSVIAEAIIIIGVLAAAREQRPAARSGRRHAISRRVPAAQHGHG